LTAFAKLTAAIAAAAITTSCSGPYREDRATTLTRRFPELSSSPSSSATLIADPLLRQRSDKTSDDAYDAALTKVVDADSELERQQSMLVDVTKELAAADAEVASKKSRLAAMRSGRQFWQWESWHRKEVDSSASAYQEALARRSVLRRRARVVDLRVENAQKVSQTAEGAAQRPTRNGSSGGPAAGRVVRVQRDTLLVMFRNDASPDEIARVLRQNRLTVRSGIAKISLFVVQTVDRSAKTPEAAAIRLRALAWRLSKVPIVRVAVQNVPLGPTTIPSPNKLPKDQKDPRDWFDKDLLGNDDPLVTSKFPQAWNFSQAIGNNRVDVGVLDEGFLDDQADLAVTSGTGCSRPGLSHGTKVAAIIAAKFDNGIGVDGAAAGFATIVGCAAKQATDELKAADPGLQKEPLFDRLKDALDKLLDRKPAVPIINVSMGYNWISVSRFASEDTKLQEIVVRQGKIVRELLRKHPDVIVVSAAGNDSNETHPEPAMWASPYNWAALGPSSADDPASPNVIVVQGLEKNGTHPLVVSNVGGTIRAIANKIPTIIGKNQFDKEDGTSGAAPLVSATIALMLARHPGLSVAQIKKNLGIDGKLGDQAPALDAFAAVKASSPTPDLDLADLDGNGVVNMKDFLTFRDDFRDLAKGPPFTVDLNKDDVIDSNEHKFCRIDLNGDGNVKDDDLDVMIRAWGDPSINPATLKTLLHQ
jgi:hypothetical protein